MEDVFLAVADSTRRQILERLRRCGPLSIKQLAEPLPISRQAVTKHLDALQEAGLVRMRRVGRLRLQSLDATPLRKMDDWLKPYADFWDERLERLKLHLEDKR